MLKLRIDLGPAAKENVSGVGQYTKRLAEALGASRDIEVTGFYFDWQRKHAEPQIDIKYASINFPQRIYAKLHQMGIRRAFDRKMDQVDATIFPNFVTWPTKKSTLRITTVHDLTYRFFPETVEKKNLKYLKKVVPQTIKKADLILTVSDTVKQEMMQEFNITNDRILTLPVPPNQTFLNFKPSDKPLAPSLKITTKYFLLFVGNFEPRKNLNVLVQAYLLLPEKVRQECSLVIAGAKGWENNDTQNLIDEAVDNGEDIIQTGNLEQAQIAQLMSEATALVMPSVYEGYGMPVTEAMAVETPVIASDIPVLHESSGEAALFFDHKSPEDLARKIAQLICQPELRAKLVKAGTEHLKTLSWQDNVNKLVAKINQLLEAKATKN